MATEDIAAQNQTPQDEIFNTLENYAWTADQEFQIGLKSILAQATSPQQRQYLTLRARCFYFTRKTGKAVDFDAYKAWREAKLPVQDTQSPVQQPSATSEAQSSLSNAIEAASAAATVPVPAVDPLESPADVPAPPPPTQITTPQQQSGETPYSANFQHIVELITTGAPIPGIKEIPDTIKTGEESSRSRGRRLKPWETEGAEQVVSENEGLTNGDSAKEEPQRATDGVNGE